MLTGGADRVLGTPATNRPAECRPPPLPCAHGGRSFQAFHDFLLPAARQEELSSLLDKVHELAGQAEHDPRLRHVHHDWLDAAGSAQQTVRQLSEQLRRFLDDQVWFENRRVIDLLRDIEAQALRLRDERTADLTMEIDDDAPALRLPEYAAALSGEAPTTGDAP